MARKSSRAWADSSGLALPSAVRRRARSGLAAAAAWAARNQVRHQWPKWNANAGRFPYHVHLHTNETMWSTSWNTARTVQGLLSAYRVLGDRSCLETAEWGLAYVKSLQVFAPEHAEARGAFIEETPLNDHVGPRDGVECAQALLDHFFATGDKVSLARAGAYLDWLIRMTQQGVWPTSYVYILPEWRPQPVRVEHAWCTYAAAIPMAQYAKASGNKKYVAWAEHFAGLTLKLLSKDGAFRTGTRWGHHSAEDDTALYNDDGIGVGLVSAWKASGKKKFLDAAVANGEWWISKGSDLPENWAMPLAVAIFMADLARATGDLKFTAYINGAADGVFSRQILRDERPLVAGAFRGEDMAEHYMAGSARSDFISLRCVSYGLIALGKLAAPDSRRWGPAYSAFGF
ncbi:MAG: hypothetical protein JW909_01475 [Planctomycetes bacterium]|nr:hypothetical protein [Planctomycetota bacterium]